MFLFNPFLVFAGDKKSFFENKKEILLGFKTLPAKKKRLYCDKLDLSFKKYSWGGSGCSHHHYYQGGLSYKKTPLVFSVWGKVKNIDKRYVTLILCGVHGDEITPMKFCYDILNYLRKISFEKKIKDKTVVVAPLVSLDSFFKSKPTRTNARKVDVNRNFPTRDWYKDAGRLWKYRYRSDPRRNPGKTAMSEEEVLFQMKLIDRFKPDKILSVHAPLTMLDYDGPSGFQEAGRVGSQANQLLIQMSQSAKSYRIKDYPFFPGSLGNYAGNERNIPTYTLELPSSDYHKSSNFWKQFRPAIKNAIFSNLKK